MKRFRRLFVFFALALALAIVGLMWMAGGVQGPRSYTASVRRLPPGPGGKVRPDPKPEILTVVVWNMAWAYGMGADGTGGAKPPAHFGRTLDSMGRLLARMNPDLVLLQEVDFASDRSHRTNQAERLARQCGLSYIAPAVSWAANYVPFPYWPPADHFGHMMSGGAVLSRYPLGRNNVELLQKPTRNPWWYNLFYLFRYVQQVEVEAPMGALTVVNAHLEAYDPDNRLNQAHRVREILEGADSAIVFGGDLNSPPPESPQRHGYADEPDTDHRSDDTVQIVRSAKTVIDTVSPGTFTSTPSAWFTFPSVAPNRKLDYLFTSDRFEVVSVRVLSEAGDLSDHLPLVAELRLK